jgi:hypothetical protein
MSLDIRRGDIVDALGGSAEILRIEANSEGSYNVTLKLVERAEDLSPDVLRAGGPDEREGDSDNAERAVVLTYDDEGNVRKAVEAGSEESEDEDTVDEE